MFVEDAPEKGAFSFCFSPFLFVSYNKRYLEMEEKFGPKRELLNELGYENSVVFECPAYDAAIIGTTDDDRVVYSYDLMVRCLMDEDNMSYEEAIEFIDYNTMRALPYFEGHPIVVHMTDMFGITNSLDGVQIDENDDTNETSD